MSLFFLYQLLYISLYRERRSRRSISLDDIPLAVDEEFREVPLDLISENASFFSLEIAIECVSMVSVHIDLRKKGEGHSEIHLADLFDRLICLRFLIQELIARESEYHEVIMRVGIPESFELFELTRETTLCRGIHDEEDFAS